MAKAGTTGTHVKREQGHLPKVHSPTSILSFCPTLLHRKIELDLYCVHKNVKKSYCGMHILLSDDKH